MKQTKKKSKCIGCGKQFTVNARNQHYCSVECREYERKKRHAQMYKKKKNTEKGKKSGGKEKHMGELASFNDKAKKLGLSYGQYMIFLQTEKDREERAKIS